MTGIWLSWHDHTRSRSLAGRLGVPMLVYTSRREGALRHLQGAVWTVGQLARTRPTVIFLQNSFLLLLICAIYRRLAGEVRLVVDCHNKSLKRRLGGPLGPLFWGLKRWSFRQVHQVIVANHLLEPIARALCPAECITALRDPLPDWTDGGDVHAVGAREAALRESCGLRDRPYVVFVCSFDSDEPSQVVLESAALLAREGTTSVVTGDAARFVPDCRSYGPRVLLPPHLPVDLYRELISGAECVVVLTEDPDCLVCGGYEAVAAGRPLVLSRTALLRAYFGEAAEFAENSAESVRDAVRRCRGRPAGARARAAASMRCAFDGEWDALCERLAAAGCLRPGLELAPTGRPDGRHG